MANLLIFGGSGFLGQALINQAYEKFNIISFARGEFKQNVLKKKFPNISLEIGNIQKYKDVNRVISKYQPNFIIIAAALKDISTCQKFPNECLKTNITGLQNVLNSLENTTALQRTVCFVSSDKGCSPINIYGTSKYLGEQLINEFNNEVCRLYSVRYGNVAGSTGSLFTAFKEQIKTGTIKITNPEMTRFNLSVEQAVETVFYGYYNKKIRGVLIPTKLKSFRIGDAAKIIAEKYKLEIEIIGAKPFEKNHEILINQQERYSISGNYLLINNIGHYQNADYSSKDSIMSKKELEALLNTYV